jgi:hypothetical protein
MRGSRGCGYGGYSNGYGGGYGYGGTCGGGYNPSVYQQSDYMVKWMTNNVGAFSNATNYAEEYVNALNTSGMYNGSAVPIWINPASATVYGAGSCAGRSNHQEVVVRVKERVCDDVRGNKTGAAVAQTNASKTSVRNESVRNESVRNESVRNESVRNESVRNESAKNVKKNASRQKEVPTKVHTRTSKTAHSHVSEPGYLRRDCVIMHGSPTTLHFNLAGNLSIGSYLYIMSENDQRGVLVEVSETRAAGVAVVSPIDVDPHHLYQFTQNSQVYQVYSQVSKGRPVFETVKDVGLSRDNDGVILELGGGYEQFEIGRRVFIHGHQGEITGKDDQRRRIKAFFVFPPTDIHESMSIHLLQNN